ncbi:PREDICTED: protein phosphatase 1 regulatory subunit 27 [Condylura cristata]|uniref:protein phosphatase 1 regulatory subunit 27 n=1 Tax=Condylura cristata TaxID=143302 RepID=UPI0006438EB5|nr:PREDICTED: protein phosphatase 1 regulatory subunit 27 [Condylura cristata]
MPSRTVRYTRYSPQQRRRRQLAHHRVRFPDDVLFLDHVRQGDLRQVQRFLRARKVALDTIHPSGLAALHEAVLSGSLECVRLLVRHGADVQQRAEAGWTALHIACSDGHPEIARYLISLGADRDAAAEDGTLPSDLVDPDCAELAELFRGNRAVLDRPPLGCGQRPAAQKPPPDLGSRAAAKQAAPVGVQRLVNKGSGTRGRLVCAPRPCEVGSEPRSVFTGDGGERGPQRESGAACTSLAPSRACPGAGGRSGRGAGGRWLLLARATPCSHGVRPGRLLGLGDPGLGRGLRRPGYSSLQAPGGLQAQLSGVALRRQQLLRQVGQVEGP